MGMPQSRSDHFGKEKYERVFTLVRIESRFIGRSSHGLVSILAPMQKEMKHCLFARFETICGAVLHSVMTDRNTFSEIKAIADLLCELWRGKWKALVQLFW
jgi:hypothetical protein